MEWGDGATTFLDTLARMMTETICDLAKPGPKRRTCWGRRRTRRAFAARPDGGSPGRSSGQWVLWSRRWELSGR